MSQIEFSSSELDQLSIERCQAAAQSVRGTYEWDEANPKAAAVLDAEIDAVAIDVIKTLAQSDAQTYIDRMEQIRVQTMAVLQANSDATKADSVQQYVPDQRTRVLVSVERIVEIAPIPGADSIERVRILGWDVIARKDELHKVGDMVLYYRIDAILPVNIAPYAFLKGKKLKTVRLHKQISQGLIGPLSWASAHGVDLSNTPEGTDLTKLFGIAVEEDENEGAKGKSTSDLGGGRGFPWGIPKTSESRIQDCPIMLRGLVGKDTEFTLKEDGCSTTFATRNGEYALCSRNWLLAEKGHSHWHKIAKTLDIKAKLLAYKRNIAIQGELTGPSIQSNRLMRKTLTFDAFKIWDIDAGVYLTRAAMMPILTLFGLTSVPVVWRGKLPAEWESSKVLVAMADRIRYKQETDGKLVRGEGFVIMVDSGARPTSCKVISDQYILKKPTSVEDDVPFDSDIIAPTPPIAPVSEIEAAEKKE